MNPGEHGPQNMPAKLPMLDRIAAILAAWPWWAVITIVGLVVAFYSVLTIPVYHRALTFVNGNPLLNTNRIADVVYVVRQPEGKTETVGGTLIKEADESVTIITQDETDVSVLDSEVTNLTCNGATSADSCPLNSSVGFSRSAASGSLIFEDLGKYTITTAFGQQQDILKIALATAPLDGTLIALDQIADTIQTTDGAQLVLNNSDIKPTACNGSPVSSFDGCALNSKISVTRKLVRRTPAGCSADANGGSCSIDLTLNPASDQNKISGLLTANSAATLTVQTVPPVITTVKKADILQTIRNDPAQCALNNIVACREGVFLTIWLTFGAFALALVLGLVFGLMRVSSNPVLYNVSTFYVEVMRGIPLLVILLFSGFVIEPWFHTNFQAIGPSLAMLLAICGVLITIGFAVSRFKYIRTDPSEFLQPVGFTLVFGGLLIGAILFMSAHRVDDPFLRAIVASIVGLAICYGAYLAELFRAGIQSIGRGQMEAARSLGMTYVQAMRFVILPQAFRVILPPLGNDFIAMLKDTSLVAILAVPELTQQARIFASKYYQPFPTYITIAVLYLCMTLFLSLMVRIVERRISYHR